MFSDLARSLSASLITPVARFLIRLGLTPNIVTVLGFVLTALVSLVLATGRLQLAGVMLVVTLAGDSIDGTMARLTGRTSRFGAFLDSTLDRWAEVVLYLALVSHFSRNAEPTAALLATIAMATSLMVSYTRARAEGVGLSCKEGLFTRFERLVLLVAGLVLNFVPWALAIIGLLAGVTAIQRIWVTWQADRAMS